MSRDQGLDADALQYDDLVIFNHWLLITRLGSILALLLLAALLTGIIGAHIPLAAIGALTALDLAVSLGYLHWLRTRRLLHLLAYVQVFGDAVALLAGLCFIESAPVLPHLLFLLVIVPAGIIGWQCMVAVVTFATAGHVLLFWEHGVAPMLSMDGVLPPALFLIVGGQALLYARHVAGKNWELEAGAETLGHLNQRLEEEGAISAALLRAAQVLTNSLDPKDILERLNDVVRSALHCDWSITLLHDSSRSLYRVAGMSGTQPEVLEELRDLEFPQDRMPLYAEVTRQGLVVAENGELPGFPSGMTDRWTASSFLCADLRHAGTSIGMLQAGFTERVGPFSPREIRLFRSIAQQAAIALENARLVESLRAASRLKSEFIGSMSHELRSPLNVVIGYVDLLLDNAMGEVAGEQRSALERVRESALQLLELIQETLDLNRLEVGRSPLDLESFSAQEFLDHLRGSVSPYWGKPGVALTWDAPPTPVLIRSDRAKLKKVLRNLIHNALKFTDSGSVAVRLSAEDGWVDFTVADSGIGMSPEVLPHIFDMFRQVDGSDTRRHGGVGLGLYIVKQLVHGLGGEISVNSTPGAGSTFSVRLRRGASEP